MSIIQDRRTPPFFTGPPATLTAGPAPPPGEFDQLVPSRCCHRDFTAVMQTKADPVAGRCENYPHTWPVIR